MDEGNRIEIHEIPWGNGAFDVAIVNKLGGSTSYAQPLVFTDARQGDIIKPAFSIGNDMAQHLFNQLWRAGFRPKDGTGNSGHIEAMKYHLEDMRKLVFKGK